MRDGIIADLVARGVGKEHSQLSRDQRREVEQMARRFGVPVDRSRNVAAIGQLLFAALQPLHELPPAYGKLLEAALYLHDVGHFVSSSSHHKHSWYVVANADLAGFTARERLLIAALCRYHRKSMPNPVHSSWQALNADERRALWLMIPVVRLADNLDRGENQHVAGLQCRLRDGGVELQVQASGAIDLEAWAAERVAEVFQHVYEKPLAVAWTRG